MSNSEPLLGPGLVVVCVATVLAAAMSRLWSSVLVLMVMFAVAATGRVMGEDASAASGVSPGSGVSGTPDTSGASVGVGPWGSGPFIGGGRDYPRTAD